MLNFTVGPVMSSDSVRTIGAEQISYFRTAEFSNVMFENENLMRKFAKAGQDSRVIFLTGSGKAAKEASVMNYLNKKDKALVVNGGSFGHRFVQFLELHDVPYTEIVLDHGKAFAMNW